MNTFRRIAPSSILLDEEVYRLLIDGLAYIHDLAGHYLVELEPPRFEKADIATRIDTIVDNLNSRGLAQLAAIIRENYDLLNQLSEQQAVLAEFVESLVSYYGELSRYRKAQRQNVSEHTLTPNSSR